MVRPSAGIVMAALGLPALAMVGAAPILADEPPTFARDVAPILWQHCVVCHRPGEAAPFSLLEYDDARKRAKQITLVTGRRTMPPWQPEPGYGEFQGDRRLPDELIETLRLWAAADAPPGDLTQLPPRPGFSAGWQLGEPDLVVRPEQEYTLAAEGSDVFRTLVLPVAATAGRYVEAIEVRPGNPGVVHHAVTFIDAQHEGRRRDAADAEVGFEGMGVGSAESPDGHFLLWAPGRSPTRLETDMAWRLPKGADLLLQLHLLPSGKPERLLPEIGLHFTEVAPTRLPVLLRVGVPTVDIPAGEAGYSIEDRYVLPVDVDVLSVVPHAHLIGKLIEGFADLPDGKRRWLLRIPSWDFSWQDEYRMKTPVALPKGSVLRMHFTYDNSAENPRNPFQPPRRVVYGPNSSDEMGSFWVQVLPRAPEDRPALVADFAQKRLVDLLALYAFTAKLKPDDPTAIYDHGTALLQNERMDEAAARFEQVLALDPRFVSAHVNLGLVHVHRKDLAAARREFEQSVALAPAHATARHNLALVLTLQGEFLAAANAYRQLLAQGQDVRAARSLAWILATAPDDSVRDAKEALLWAKRAASSAPKDPVVLDTLAAAYAEAGRFKDAILTAKEAIDLARARGDEAFAEQAVARQQLYRERRPWRDERPK